MIFITFHGCSNEDVGENNDPTSLTEEDTEDYDCYIGYGYTGYEACKNVLVIEFADMGYGRCKKRTVSFRITTTSSPEVKLIKDKYIFRYEDYYQKSVCTSCTWYTGRIEIPYSNPSDNFSFTVEMNLTLKDGKWEHFYDVVDTCNRQL